MNINDRDISILTQVVFKEFCNVNKKFPNEEDWKSINKTTIELFRNINNNLETLFDSEPPFKGDEFVKEGSFMKRKDE